MAGQRRIARAGELLLTIDGLTVLAFDARTGAASWQSRLEKPIESIVRGPGANEATAIDEDGAAHALDLKDGAVQRSAKPVGTSVAAAASSTLVAIASKDGVSIDGEKVAIDEPSALAFSREGKKLAVVSKKSTLVIVDPVTRTVLDRHALPQKITDIAPSVDDQWLIATPAGLFTVDRRGEATKVMDRAVTRLALDPERKRIALQRDEDKVAVYAWPPEEPLMRMMVEAPRTIDGIAWTMAGELAFGFDGGDAGIVDLATKEGRGPTEPHAGREMHKWTLQVQRGATMNERPSAGVAVVPEKSHTTRYIAIAGAIIVALILLRVIRQPETPPPPPPPPLKPIVTPSTAKSGEAPAPAFEVLRLTGTKLEAAPDPHRFESRGAERLWVAPNGTTFVMSQLGMPGPCTLEVKLPAASSTPEWRIDMSHPCTTLLLFGRTFKDVYAAFDGEVYAFDGTKDWKQIGAFASPIVSLAGLTTSDDLYALSDDGTLHHRKNAAWTDEKPEVDAQADIDELFSGPALWTHSGDSILKRMATDWLVRGTGGPVEDLWVGPSGNLFVARTNAVAHSADDGASWKEQPLQGAELNQIWGRTNTDVYAAGPKGIWHWDGVTWSKTAFDRPVEQLGGDAKDLVVVVPAR